MYNEGSVADFFTTPWLPKSPGGGKKSATERLIIHVCKGKNAAYVAKNELLFCDTELFFIEEMRR